MNEVQVLANGQWHVGREIRRALLQEIFVIPPVGPFGSTWRLAPSVEVTKFSLSFSCFRES
jgi:hypothetical protein